MILTRTEQTGLFSLPDPDPSEPATALQAVDQAVKTVFGPPDQSRDSGGSKAGSADTLPIDAIAFSGGVDSTLIAAACPDATLYVGGFEDSHDRKAARDVAAAMGRELREIEFTHETLIEAVPQIVAATGRTNPMDVGIALPLYLVARAAATDGADTLGVGQGADELFGGYAKMADPATDTRLESETVRGAQREVISGLPAQLERDVLTLRAAGVEPWTPFLDDRVIDTALRLPGQLLATRQLRKSRYVGWLLSTCLGWP
jgi:Asparagine synthase (glutamine-hydrolyzing)